MDTGYNRVAAACFWVLGILSYLNENVVREPSHRHIREHGFECAVHSRYSYIALVYLSSINCVCMRRIMFKESTKPISSSNPPRKTRPPESVLVSRSHPLPHRPHHHP
jgi:hypothetical protein